MPPPPSPNLLRFLRSSLLAHHHHPPHHPYLTRPLPSHHTPLLLLPTHTHTHTRTLTTTPTPPYPSSPPLTPDRGPPSTESTQTNFSSMDVFTNTPAPTASIDACLSDGFHLDNGVKIGGGSGVLLVQGEAFGWRPWGDEGKGGRRLLNEKGQWEVGSEGWGILDLVWPKPDLLILGLGPSMHPLSPTTRKYINGLGIRVDVQDTRNAAAQFNLLATERGVGEVAAALVPVGWREGG